MFEKEAEERYYKNYPVTLNIGEEERYNEVTNIWKDGAKFGYNKDKEQVESIIKRLVENKPDTYSGTDAMINQKKMFAFSRAVDDAIEYLKE